MDCNCEEMSAFLREPVLTPAARVIFGLAIYISLFILIELARVKWTELFQDGLFSFSSPISVEYVSRIVF